MRTEKGLAMLRLCEAVVPRRSALDWQLKRAWATAAADAKAAAGPEVA
ncbi:MAG TPA: hypothetical protein VEZ89_07935 [Rubrivivax sp.]|nr:hypothetical protein [Rubrivivax sp.]